MLPRFYLILATCLLSTLTVWAQMEQPLRVEIDLENNTEDHLVIPVGEYGVVMYTLSSENLPQRTKVKWLFTGYNTEFNEIWKSGYIIDDSYDVRKHFYANGFIYFLYGRYNREEFVLAELNVGTGEIKSFNGRLPRKFDLSAMNVHRNFVYINGSTRKGPALLTLDLTSGKLEEVQLEFEHEANFESIDVNANNDLVNLTFIIDDKRKRYLNLKSFYGNELVDDIIINPEGDDNLLTGKINTISENEKIIIGTYSVGDARGANGLYFARLINNSSFIIKYYNFTDFRNFFDYLPDRTLEKIQRKKERKSSKGKEYNLDYHFLVHDLKVQNGQYLMVAEAYYATYRSEAYPYTTIINGVPIVQTNYVSVFDGWLYTHAIIAGFDFEGNMLWDNSIEMGDVKSYNLQERVSVNSDIGEVRLAYGTYENIVTKSIRENNVLEEKDKIMIKTGFSNDVVKSYGLNHVHYWYDNYFIVYGYQRIKNKDEDIKRKRTVFFFNKIAVK